uniref:Uncharacterized protein n=1 Tax=Clandestinovirus TaxID=2831644 RepID=A0A8F8PKG0_9VIRU|nr:hypothetical protein KOM_12_473 [Clandestinovirus]
MPGEASCSYAYTLLVFVTHRDLYRNLHRLPVKEPPSEDWIESYFKTTGGLVEYLTEIWHVPLCFFTNRTLSNIVHVLRNHVQVDKESVNMSIHLLLQYLHWYSLHCTDSKIPLIL